MTGTENLSDEQVSSTLFFDTSPLWIAAVRHWASHDQRVSAVWVFGSRANGRRSDKVQRTPQPDLDIGYTLTGEHEGERLAYAMFEVARARGQLQAAIGVPLDLHLAEPETDERVWPAITNHGVKIYQRQ